MTEQAIKGKTYESRSFVSVQSGKSQLAMNKWKKKDLNIRVPGEETSPTKETEEILKQLDQQQFTPSSDALLNKNR